MADGNSEGMFQQAQQIWQMLDDMAQNDPQSYRKFIDKQMNEAKETMKPPQPHMCVQTNIISDCNLFINICGWVKLPEPKSDEDPIPVAGGYIYDGKDQNGKHKIITIAFNPAVLEEFGRNSSLTTERRLLINLAIDYIQDQYNLQVSRSFSILPEDTMFKGPKEKVKQTLLDKFQSQKSSEDKQFEKELEELEKSFGPLASGCKDSLLKEMANISLGDQSENGNNSHDTSNSQTGINILSSSQSPLSNRKNLIEEVSSTENKLPEPEYSIDIQEAKDLLPRSIKVSVRLPGITSVKDCELDISEDDVHLEAGDKYELTLVLPEKIQEQSASAKFSKKTSTLNLTLPTS